MRRAMKEYGLPEPVFENRRNEFVVTFYNSAQQEVLTQQRQSTGADSLLEFCNTPRTRQEIAEYLGVKTAFYAIQHYVKPLLESGKLAQTLPEKPKSRHQKYYTVK